MYLGTRWLMCTDAISVCWKFQGRNGNQCRSNACSHTNTTTSATQHRKPVTDVSLCVALPCRGTSWMSTASAITSLSQWVQKPARVDCLENKPEFAESEAWSVQSFTALHSAVSTHQIFSFHSSLLWRLGWHVLFLFWQTANRVYTMAIGQCCNGWVEAPPLRSIQYTLMCTVWYQLDEADIS